MPTMQGGYEFSPYANVPLLAPVDRSVEEKDLIDDLLTPDFREAGCKAITSIARSFRKLRTATGTNDEAWANVYDALVHEFEPHKTDEAGLDLGSIEIEDRKRVLGRLHDRFGKPINAIEIALRLADAAIEAPSTVQPSGVTTLEQWAYLEGLLWRIRDGLEAVTLLQPKGLHSEVMVTLRCVTEAVFIFDYIWQNPAEAQVMRSRALAHGAKIIEELIDYDTRKGEITEASILESYNQILADLSCAGFTRKAGRDGKRVWEPKNPGRNPSWQDFINSETVRKVEGDDVLYRVFGDTRHLPFYNIYIQGDGFAHSLPGQLDGWVALESGKLLVKGKVKGSPCHLHYLAVIVVKKFVEQLSRMRPQLPYDYGSFFNVVSRESFYAANADMIKPPPPLMMRIDD